MNPTNPKRFSPPPAKKRAGDREALLDRSGVKLVAVEFYATWCKPCMAAVPRWKALHDRYRSQGLRLIVINTQDPNGACSAPGWAPDELICDLEGHIAEAMKVSNLPSAFLYSWQGNTLVERAHIEEVEREIEAYMLRNPRVRVDAKGRLPLRPSSAMSWPGRVNLPSSQPRKNKPSLLRHENWGIKAITKAKVVANWDRRSLQIRC